MNWLLALGGLFVGYKLGQRSDAAVVQPSGDLSGGLLPSAGPMPGGMGRGGGTTGQPVATPSNASYAVQPNSVTIQTSQGPVLYTPKFSDITTSNKTQPIRKNMKSCNDLPTPAERGNCVRCVTRSPAHYYDKNQPEGCRCIEASSYK